LAVAAVSFGHGDGEIGSAKATSAGAAKTMDFTVCQSRGGNKNCAVCDDTLDGDGGLPCSGVRGKSGDTDKSSACNDFLNPSNGALPAVWIQQSWWSRSDTNWCTCSNGDLGCLDANDQAAPYDQASIAASPTADCTRFGQCVSIDAARPMWTQSLKIQATSTGANIDGLQIVTKAFMIHPYKASWRTCAFGFKRVVSHEYNGQTYADVHKVGYCLRCQNAIVDDITASELSTTDLSSLGGKSPFDLCKTCIQQAFNSTGHVKDGSGDLHEMGAHNFTCGDTTTDNDNVALPDPAAQSGTLIGGGNNLKSNPAKNPSKGKDPAMKAFKKFLSVS